MKQQVPDSVKMRSNLTSADHTAMRLSAGRRQIDLDFRPVNKTHTEACLVEWVPIYHVVERADALFFCDLPHFNICRKVHQFSNQI